MNTKTATISAIAVPLALILSTLCSPASEAVAADVVVYKNAQCSCCAKWVEHLSRYGFHVTTHNVTSINDIKSAHGVPAPLASCHTAIVDGYVVEGHVPADAIQRLLTERPQVNGIAVPGMPVGSPGMEGSIVQRYDITSFDAQGNIAIYGSR